MAFLGSIGKVLGLGSTAQVLGSAARGALTAVATGSPVAGGAVGIGGAMQQQGQAVAVDAPAQTLPQESAQSSQAAIGGILPMLPATGTLVGAARQAFPAIGRLIGSPAGQIAVGTGVGLGLGAMGGDGQPAQIRFTRKQQMQVKEMVELLGFDGAMQVLGVDASTLAFMLTKKFPRRGQGITAAQLRNAQRVNNKIVHMHDKLKSSFGAATRRTTARRSTTRVTQIKN